MHFGFVGLHFLAFWPCGPSFPCILALWAFISLHFGLVGLHFLAFWPFRGQLLGPPPQVAKNGPFAQRPYNGFSSARTGSILQFLAFRAFISLHFGLVGLHFLAFWLCGPSFPCILALWAFISLHFGLVGLHFLAFWPFRGQLLPPPPQVAKTGPFAQRPYNGFSSAMTGSILQFLAFRAFISLHFGLVGLHFLAFWPCGPSFPFILAFWAFISFHFGLLGFHFLSFWHFRPLFPVILAFWACISFHCGLLGLVGLHFLAFWLCGLHFLSFWLFRGQLLGSSPQVAKNGLFAQRPYNGFISARTGSILQFLAFWAFISLHFRLVGLHFLAFWLCGPSFPCILVLWAFISLHFGLVGLHFLAFWPFRGQLLGPPPQVAKNRPFAQRPYNGFSSPRTGSIFVVFSLQGLYFLAFWPCRPSFPCILALWAFISLHFGLVGLHFLAFWPFRGQLLGPLHKLPKIARLPKVLTKDLAVPGPAPFCSFLPSGPLFPCILAL